MVELTNHESGHANRFLDFRIISLYPSLDEILSEDVFLPLAANISHTPPWLHDSMKLHFYLDRHFRLLRENMNDLTVRSVKVTDFIPSFDRRSGLSIQMRLEQPPECLKEWKHSAVVFVLGWEDFITNKDKSHIKFLSLGIISKISYGDDPEYIDPTIDVTFASKDETISFYLENGRNQEKIHLFKLSAKCFELPILERLKVLSKLPFEPEILHDSMTEPPVYFDEIRDVVEKIEKLDNNSDLNEVLPLQCPVVLDSSQKAAVTQSLRNRVALIQGPPGTGKSYCGAIIAKILLEHTNEKILCVCHTNHAIDQFLEDLLAIGVPTSEMVRLGGSRKISDSIKELTLDSIKEMNGKESDHCLNPIVRSIYKDIDKLKEDFTRDLIDPNEFDKWVDFYLRSNVALQTLHMLPTEWENQIKKLRRQLTEPYMEQIKRQVSLYKNYATLIDEVYLEEDLSILRSKRVVGCTATGAAINSKKLDNIDIGVLILEEAGEILETNVVAAMPVNCKHLIMIGDHKQLRPKLYSYELSVESGGPYKFNCSLFERLATKDFPHARLRVQHRMRPEISDLVRNLTELCNGHPNKLYPDLEDAPEVFDVLQRPNVRGVKSNVIFIHHEEPEGNWEDMVVGEIGDEESKVNVHEAKMVTEIVRYFLRQNYQGKQITVLTPYQAQKRLLQANLKHEFDNTIKDGKTAFPYRHIQIYNGVVNVSELPFTTPDSKKPSVRVSTIDSFQGEEADIIIGSLVRSNSKGSIGFVRELGRVNVLLSRARICLVLIGNKNTFEACKSIKSTICWQDLFQQLNDKNAVLSYFPAYCRVHDKLLKLADPEGFQNQVSEMGCGENHCNLMSCGQEEKMEYSFDISEFPEL